MSAPESHYKAKYPRTYAASFVARSMVDGRELWCVGREVCAQIEAEHAALLSQVARLRDSLTTVEGRLTKTAQAFYVSGKRNDLQAAFDGWKEDAHQARALLAETEQP